jgi:hypothetical protein
MTKKILDILAGLILLFAMAAPLQAGSILNHEMTVTVPFEFAVGGFFPPATTPCNSTRNAEPSSCGAKDRNR